MNQVLINKAAQILWDAWDTGENISELPQDCRPTDRQSAYKIQRQVNNEHCTVIPNPEKSKNIETTTPNSDTTAKSIEKYEKVACNV